MRATHRFDGPHGMRVKVGDRLVSDAWIKWGWQGDNTITSESKVRTVAAIHTNTGDCRRWFLLTSEDYDPMLIGPSDYRYWYIVEDDPPEPKQVKVRMWWHPTRPPAMWSPDQLKQPWRKEGYTLVEFDATEVQ